MGKPGPKPTPTAILKSRGSWRAKERAGEPSPPAGDMVAPPWLLPEAREHWQDIAATLEGIGIASPAFSPALALLVNSLARYISLEQTIAATGTTYESANGNHLLHPAAIARDRAFEQVVKLLVQFGLTPSSITSTSKQSNDSTSDANSARSAALRLIS